MATVLEHDLETGSPDARQQGAPEAPKERAPVNRWWTRAGTAESAEPARRMDAAGVGLAAPVSPADGELVERVRRGEPAAFDALVRRHDQRAFALAYRLLGHREDAEDVVQESFIAALDALDRFDATRPFGPWLYRIVVNRSLNARKARSRRVMEVIPEDAASPVAAPDRAVETAEARARLRGALASLSQRQRSVIEMIELEGFSGPEVAEILGIPEGTIRWHLHGARKALRAALGPDEGGPI